MHLPVSVTQDELLEVLLQVAPVRPVFIWGAPGIGKSALVEKFADEVGLPCVAPWKPARAGGHYRHSADPGRDLGIPSAENDRQKRAICPVPGRTQRLYAGSAESLLFPDP